MTRYEVRRYYYEEMLPENRMTYSPCRDREEAKQKYADALSEASDLVRVDLCEVSYVSNMYGCYENVKVLASSESDNPRHIVWEEDDI